MTATATAPARRGRPPKRDTAFRYGNPENRPKRPTPLPGYRPKRKLPTGAHAHIESRNLPITMPSIPDRGIDDESLGLTRNDAAQLKAEGWLTVVLAQQLRDEAKARDAARLASARSLAPGPTIAVEVPDDAVALLAPTDVLDDVDQGILRELRRLTARPPTRWRAAAA
ncbi:hypothetical protein JHFBIEKO_4801 [Methylobacterium mesophilicum]|nr:hypothetical protein JHFBIEKO_4801 [Methylobacterium mesophilicum]